MFTHYSPWRVWKSFRLLLTVFMTVRRKERFLFMRPLSPAALKQTILDLGVCHIKMAQVLATRADFFTEDYLEELRTIHDEVEPMAQKDFQVMFQRAFGEAPPFAEFEETPLASASIGQVHKARLKDGTQVAVKIRRLGILQGVLADIRLVTFFLRMFQPFFSRYTKNSLEAVLKEFTSMIKKEVDMAIEADHLRKFRETYGHCDVRIPGFFPEYSSPDALVMTFEQGVRVDDKERLAALNIDFRDVMARLIDFYTEQMLIKGFFHADPHPGNVLVAEDGTLTILDFGMVKRLPASMRLAMIELVQAAHEQDFESFIGACKRMGVVAASAPESQMQELAERLFDIFGNESLNAASMQSLALDVLDSMKELPFKLPQDVVYVMRASALIEGLGTSFIENFNGVKDVLPVLKRNMYRALGAEAKLFPTLGGEIKALPLTVRRFKAVLTDLSDGTLRVRLSPETLELVSDGVLKRLKPLGLAALFILAAFFIQGYSFRGSGWIAAVLFAFGAIRLYLGVK
ncbi:MAG: AarF/ABC1/UbiB kinase family protein [Desulfovibrio sp.]|nr:MAG: AarF/ABC1/UbiB kinase family protein [Desulfovibrio sp.]